MKSIISLLVVMLIVPVLFLALYHFVGGLTDRDRLSRARTDLLAIKSKILELHYQRKAWPSGETVEVLADLIYEGAINSANDPWGQMYHVEIDRDGDGRVQIGETNLNSRVEAWSSGPNKDNEFGTGDDLRSWFP